MRIGLTGGIGAGKSTVSAALEAKGAVLVDADRVAREVVEPGTPGLAALVERFGDGILRADGALDRPALAAVAFANDESRAALNAITHPLVGARTQEIVDAAPSDAIVVQDIPLLVEGAMAPLFHVVVVVFTDEAERVRRLVELRGMPEADARARIAAQATDEQRRAVADVWLDNSGAPGALDDTISALWAERLVPFAENVRDGVVVRPRVELVGADPSWPAQAERLIARLRVLSGAAALRIDHIGSTAVPGLDAKDVLDIQITVADLDAADALAAPLAAGGFPRVDTVNADDPKPAYQGGETDPALWAKRLHGNADPGRPANVHIRVDGWPAQQFALVMRDWLRSDDAARDEYLQVKRRAAAAAAEYGSYDAAIAAYLDVKEPWFDRAFHRAHEWARETGWTATSS
nr:dephospho-CoA kinase [Rhodococcus sp. HNM0569]